MSRSDETWRDVPADAPSLEEMFGPEKVAEAKRTIRRVYERFEEIGRRYGRRTVPTSEGDTEADPGTLTDPDWDWRRTGTEPDQASDPLDGRP